MIKILAVDDIDDNLRILGTIIGDAFPGSIYYSALDGKTGIELAVACDPDVIILDIVMPDIDGFEVCRILKNDSRTTDIPVVFLTSITDIRENRIKAMESGAEAFLSKPFDEIELTAQIRAMVKIKASVNQKRAENEKLALLVAERTHKLEESEQRYRLLFESSSVGICYCSGEGVIISLNRIAASLMGGQPRDFAGKSIFEVFPEKYAALYMKRIKRAIILKKPQKYEEKSFVLSENRWVQSTVVRIQDSGNKVVGVQTILKDITKSKHAEDAIRNSEAKYHDIFINSPIGIWDEDFSAVKQRFDELHASGITDLRSYLDANPQEIDYLASLVRIVNVNDITIKMLGCENKSQFLNDLKSFFVPESLALFKEEMIAIENGKTRFECVIPAITINKQQRLFQLSLVVPPAYTSTLSRVLVSCIDITEHRKKELELKHSYELLTKLTMQVPGVVFQYRLYPNGHSCFPFTSQAVSKYGILPEEIREDASPVFPLIHPDDCNSLMLAVQVSSQTMGLLHIEFRFKIWGKGDIWFLCDAKPERLDDGSTLWHGIVSDITERKIAEVRLQESEARFKGIFDHSAIGIRIVNHNGIVIDENKRMSQITGYPYSEVVGHTIWDVIYRQIPGKKSLDVLEKIKKECAVALKTGSIRFKINNGDIHLQCKNGQIKSVKTSYFSIRNKQGYVLYSLVTDETEILKVQNEIRKLQKAIESSDASIVITDSNGLIEYANPIFSQISGYLPEEYLGKNQNLIKTDFNDHEFYVKLWQTIKSGQTWQGEFYNRKKNGDCFWEHAIISPIKNEKQVITHFVAIKTDITDSKKINAELLIAKEKAEEINHLKTALLSNLSHEIRTPMSAIMGFSDLMSEAEGDEKNIFATIVQKCSKQLLNLIDDVILLSRLQSEKMTIRIGTMSPTRILNDTYHKFNDLTIKKDLNLLVSIPKHHETIMVQTDEFKIRLVIDILISNALKYTLEGSVELGFDIHDGILEFFVKDTGVGISDHEQLKIFDSFYRAEQTRTLAIGGTGLGLSIAKEMVQLLGGKIGVASEPDRGSLFHFNVPVKISQSALTS